VNQLEDDLRLEFGVEMPVADWLSQDKSLYEETLRDRILEKVEETYKSKEDQYGQARI